MRRQQIGVGVCVWEEDCNVIAKSTTLAGLCVNPAQTNFIKIKKVIPKNFYRENIRSISAKKLYTK